MESKMEIKRVEKMTKEGWKLFALEAGLDENDAEQFAEQAAIGRWRYISQLTPKRLKEEFKLAPGDRDLLETFVEKAQKPVRRSWTFGTIIDPDVHFYVPFQQLVGDLVEKIVIPHKFALVQAPFRFGKTSHLIALEQVLNKQGFSTIKIYCQDSIIWTQEQFNELKERVILE
eukprot:TRINITY_DN4109_c0_g1_i2.p1 TRINITY_DN4109_c0_g1~~TRINITY_DN4109_c0_g1_i2.p1  ORF type:complete len:173 (+),score=32.21 TRINITY_DN4109_c0_g1_i2:289-807(+)